MPDEAKTAQTAPVESVYQGFLGTVLDTPAPGETDSVPSITFSKDDLLGWKLADLDFAMEWRQVSGKKLETAGGVTIEGDFERVVAIDSLSPQDPRFWTPLSTIGVQDDRFPIDATQYPVIEITYRCTSERAHPTWMWLYEGGSHFGALPRADEWTTVARNIQHFGFPERVDGVVVRLYSPTRTTESMEVSRIRFRAMTEREKSAVDADLAGIQQLHTAKSFPILEEFLPLGVYMDALSAKRLAAMLGISPPEYWGLVVEDLVLHDHNAIALANFDRMPQPELEHVLSLCEANNIRIVARHEFSFDGDVRDADRTLRDHVAPHADSRAILAHTFSGEPIESDFHAVLQAKKSIEDADPNHPVAIIARYPNAYPLFAPFFAASGVGYFTSRRPWAMGTMVRAHVPLSPAQQFWVAAPSFVYPTETPEWGTCPEMRLMVNLSFANGARGWFAYSYHNDPVWLRGRVQRTLTGPFLTFSDLWMELMHRMQLMDALAPLFLGARPEPAMDSWYEHGFTSDSPFEPLPGISPISRFHLRGDGYSLYITVSNNTREITSANIDVPGDLGSDVEIHDLTNYVLTQDWQQMPRQRHIEMFPGQEHVMLVAPAAECERWREVITARLVRSDLQKLQYDLELLRAHGLDTTPVDDKLSRIRAKGAIEEIGTVHSARTWLTDKTYSVPGIRAARSHIIAASAAVCACDGALCLLMSQGKTELARELGQEVIPLAREFTHHRLALRRGHDDRIAGAAEQVKLRALALLERIRVEYDARAFD